LTSALKVKHKRRSRQKTLAFEVPLVLEGHPVAIGIGVT
jgi:hypothetical protein